MTGNWLRRTMMTVACASFTLLAACGSGTIESALNPSRLVVFGDGMSDVGQSGARYTVNDGTVNTWVEQLAFRYSLTVKPSSAGGAIYARGNARVTAKPDAAGNAATPTLTEQIDGFLAATPTVSANDLVILNAGLSDIIAEMAVLKAGTQTEAQLVEKVKQAGRELGAQVRRLTVAGYKHVVVVGPYNLGRSLWAPETGKAGFLTDVTNRFNEEMLVSVVDLGDKVLYVDAALFFNLLISAPAGYELADATKIACNSVDSGNGIGIGVGQVNSLLCTPSTIASGLDYKGQAFADKNYFNPMANRKFGDYAFDRIRARW
jgi:phospholipase/lecithinase/hemolysin